MSEQAKAKAGAKAYGNPGAPEFIPMAVCDRREVPPGYVFDADEGGYVPGAPMRVVNDLAMRVAVLERMFSGKPLRDVRKDAEALCAGALGWPDGGGKPGE